MRELLVKLLRVVYVTNQAISGSADIQRRFVPILCLVKTFKVVGVKIIKKTEFVDVRRSHTTPSGVLYKSHLNDAEIKLPKQCILPECNNGYSYQSEAQMKTNCPNLCENNIFLTVKEYAAVKAENIDQKIQCGGGVATPVKVKCTQPSFTGATLQPGQQECEGMVDQGSVCKFTADDGYYCTNLSPECTTSGWRQGGTGIEHGLSCTKSKPASPNPPPSPSSHSSNLLLISGIVVIGIGILVLIGLLIIKYKKTHKVT